MKLNEAVLIVFRHIKNAFVTGAERGDFTIHEGNIALAGAYLTGEWIAITGSKLNNGIYQLTCTGPLHKLSNGSDDEIPVVDETFTGSVWRIGLPMDFIILCNDLCEYFKSPAGKPSDVVSESVVGFHSVTHATSSSGAPVGWDKVFSARINPSWRNVWEPELLKKL